MESAKKKTLGVNLNLTDAQHKKKEIVLIHVKYFIILCSLFCHVIKTEPKCKKVQ